MSSQFVDGWSIVQVLGEGAFGEVKLLVNNETNEAIAVKTINTTQHKDAQLAVKKEIAIHRAVTHQNIIRFYGCRSEPGFEYIFLEYAAGGELFDRIEPDFGMKSKDAQKYLMQIVSGVEYLHERGVTHRDIKPENILLDHQDDVKLSDFGMATMFRKNGKERLLDKKCGTMPYVAPEVLERPYKAVPADMWSCGVVLIAMLAGELPWDVPSLECTEFVMWKKNEVTKSPWNKLDTVVLGLLRKLLSLQPSKRPTASELLQHRWMQAVVIHDPVPRTPSKRPAKRLHSEVDRPTPESDPDSPRLCATQPLPQQQDNTEVDESPEGGRGFWFSQPALLDNMLLSSQLHATQATSLSNYQKLVKRMTRFVVRLAMEPALERLTACLEALACGCRRGPHSVLTATTTDRRKMNLVFKVNLIEMSGNILLDFRLSKGDGLEFKKIFVKVKNSLVDIAVRCPILWVEDG